MNKLTKYVVVSMTGMAAQFATTAILDKVIDEFDLLKPLAIADNDSNRTKIIKCGAVFAIGAGVTLTGIVVSYYAVNAVNDNLWPELKNK